MASCWIANASPIIVLAKIGRLGLLQAPGIDLLIPQGVAREIEAGRPDDPAREALARGMGLRVEVTSLSPEVVEWGLGRGESEVLTLARAHQGATAILDDAEARMCARALAVPVMGTIGLVVRAQRREELAAVAPVFDELQRAGLRLDAALVGALLRELGEG